MIEIKLFGQLSVRVDGREVTGLSGKQREILAILALEAGSPVSKDRLADLLWQGSPPASYVGTLDSYVCVLRRRLGLAAGRGSQLSTSQAGFRLDHGTDVHIDVCRFRELAHRRDDTPSAEVAAQAEQALELVTGELLAEVPYADWAVRARESFRSAAVDLWLHGAQRANALGEPMRAERLARAATDRDPICEDAWRQLMLAYWFSGRRTSALAAYGELRAAMADYLGDEPGQQSQRLYETVLRDVPEVRPDAGTEEHSELRVLLRLLRQAIDATPGLRAPARDSALSEVAMRAIAGACV